MNILKKGLLVLVALAAIFAVFAFTQLRSLEVEKLSDDLYVIRGIGGNTTVLKTDAGAVVIDSMTFVMQGKLISSKVLELTGSKPSLLINTHYHLDHTHGNPGFELGIRIISTDNTLSHLTTLDSEFWQGDKAKLLPNETFSDRQTLVVGHKKLQLIHPGRGHTNGDLVVLIEDEETMVMGDLLFNQSYPNIDLEAGGSVQEWSTTLDNVLQSKFVQVIPGHGATTDRLGINNFQRFTGQLAKLAIAAAADEISLKEFLQSSSLNADKNFVPLKIAGISLGLDREFVLRRAWQEATGNFERKN